MTTEQGDAGVKKKTKKPCDLIYAPPREVGKVVQLTLECVALRVRVFSCRQHLFSVFLLMVTLSEIFLCICHFSILREAFESLFFRNGKLFIQRAREKEREIRVTASGSRYDWHPERFAGVLCRCVCVCKVKGERAFPPLVLFQEARCDPTSAKRVMNRHPPPTLNRRL